MKKLISILLLASIGALAGIVEETKSKPVLAGSVVIAPFSEVSAKVTNLGTMINNPLVPMLLCSSVQQSLSQTYGRFSAEQPMGWLVYLQTPAWEIAATNDDMVAYEELYDVVLVYPSVDKAARMKLNNPGSTQAADGTIHLLASENRAKDQYVKFSTDGRHCAFASSPALAAQALVDFERTTKANAKSARPLVTLSVPERGLTALETAQVALNATASEAQKAMGAKTNGVEAALQDDISKLVLANQKRQLDMLKRFKGVEMALDLNAKGLEFTGTILPKPGSPVPAAAGARLPAGALEGIPPSTAFFLSVNEILQTGAASEAEFRADVKTVVDLLNQVDALVAKEKSMAEYRALVKEIKDAVVEALETARYPAPSDWSSCALAFDSELHPYLAAWGVSEQAAARQQAGDKLVMRLIAALEKQFPKSGVFTRKAAGAYSIDWAALIDFAGAQAGVKPGDAEAKDLQDAKKNVERVLGATRTDFMSSVDGKSERQLIAKPDFKLPVANPSKGGNPIGAALPEIEKDRPASVLYFTPYAFTRNVLLPTLAKFAKTEDAQQYRTMIMAMAEPEANSAIAGAGWCEANGSYRWLLRVTANELKNFGAAFNAFTAASMSSALGGAGDNN